MLTTRYGGRGEMTGKPFQVGHVQYIYLGDSGGEILYSLM